MLDVVLVQELGGGLRVAGGKGVDEGQGFVHVALRRLGVLGGGGGVRLLVGGAAAAGQDAGGHGEGEEQGGCLLQGFHGGCLLVSMDGLERPDGIWLA